MEALSSVAKRRQGFQRRGKADVGPAELLLTEEASGMDGRGPEKVMAE